MARFSLSSSAFGVEIPRQAEGAIENRIGGDGGHAGVIGIHQLDQPVDRRQLGFPGEADGFAISHLLCRRIAALSRLPNVSRSAAGGGLFGFGAGQCL